VPTYRTATEAETIALGETLARAIGRGVVLLIGNLGAGKTTLAKGMAQGLGAAPADEVSSPTFTLIHEYGGGRVYHIDLYRLDEARQVETLGLEELFDRDALVLIEWGERFPQLLPAERTEIRIRALPDDSREITLEFLRSSAPPR
jgi:tRNA threonylcarbamoyladenosine biosynthesis protein TsaE